MSNEFRPVEMAPRKWPAWPFAVAGAAVVGLLIFAARRESAPIKAQATELAHVARSAIAPALTQSTKDALKPDSKPAETTAARPEASKEPNVIGAAAPVRERMVPSAELERERARTRGAQKAAAAYRKQLDEMKRQLASANDELSRTRGQLSAVLHPRQPPPSDQETILRTLAPVLQGSNN